MSSSTKFTKMLIFIFFIENNETRIGISILKWNRIYKRGLEAPPTRIMEI